MRAFVPAWATIRRRAEGAGAERSHGVVVRQHEVAERLVADAVADDVDPLLGHVRRRTRLDGEDRIGPDDGSDVRVALRGVGEHPVRQLLQGGLFRRKVRR